MISNFIFPFINFKSKRTSSFLFLCISLYVSLSLSLSHINYIIKNHTHNVEFILFYNRSILYDISFIFHLINLKSKRISPFLFLSISLYVSLSLSHINIITSNILNVNTKLFNTITPNQLFLLARFCTFLLVCLPNPNPTQLFQYTSIAKNYV